MGALGDGDASVRESAAAALGQFGSAAGEALPAIIDKLFDTGVEVRRSAANALKRIGAPVTYLEPVMAALHRLNNTGDVWARQSLVDAWSCPVLAAMPALIALFSGANRDIRRQIASALKFVEPNAVAARVAAFVSDDPTVRAGVAYSIGRIRPDVSLTDEAVRILTSGLKDKDWDVRCSCAYPLGCMGPPASSPVDPLIEARDAEFWEIRRNAAHALGEIGGPTRTALSALAGAVGDDDLRVAQSATQSLGKLGSLSEQLLVAAFQGVDPDLRFHVRGVPFGRRSPLKWSAPLRVDRLSEGN
jgi:HEAT repeat protein